MHRGALTTVFLVAALAAATLTPDVAEAAHRHRRYYRGRYYGYPSFYFGYGPGFYPSFGFGYHYFPFSIGFAFPGGPKDDRPAVRFQVRPKHAEVYVDGYYAGVVDDLDGSKRLRLDPGPHEVTIYLDGYRTFSQLVNPGPGNTVRLRHDLEPLLPGEAQGARPTPSSPPGATSPPPVSARPAPPAAVTAAPPPPSTSGPPATASSTEFGSLVLRAQPSDVEIVVDGELWSFPQGAESLTLHLPAGRYRVEVEKDGYESFRTQVDLAPGERTDLNVQLKPASP
jgi:hypothetical protein